MATPPPTPGLFSTLRPLSPLPPTPILSLLLTYLLYCVNAPRSFYGPLKGENYHDPASLLARVRSGRAAGVSQEKITLINRAQGAADNLKECMPLFVVASLSAWLGGVKPEWQNAYHVFWVLARWSYKGAYLRGWGGARGWAFMLSQLATLVMLVLGGNALAKKTDALGY